MMTQTYKKLCTLLCTSILLTSLLSAQEPCASLEYHAFKAEYIPGTFTSLGNQGSVIITSEIDDGYSSPLSIGFTFEFQCQEYTQFIFSTNGYIKLGTKPMDETDVFFSNAQSTNNGIFEREDSTLVNLLVAFNHDLTKGPENADFRWHTTGSAPNRVCIIQWDKIREWTNDPPYQYENMIFQIRLYETTNVIEFAYGEWIPTTNPSNFKTASVGIKGSGNADDQILKVVKASSATWDNVTFSSGNYQPNESFNFGNPPDRPGPVDGTIYRFTPTYQNDLTVRQVYALSQASTYYSSPQTIRANIRNSGFQTQTNIPVTLEISGPDPFTDVQYIPALAFGEDTTITFNAYIPSDAGESLINVYVESDETVSDNAKAIQQTTGDFTLNYAHQAPPDESLGFLAGVQGIYYARYPVSGSAEVASVNVYIADDSASVDKTVFAIVLNDAGEVTGRSENYQIQESDLGTWHNFTIPETPLVKDESLYAGFGMTSSLQDYAALGVQNESPLREETFYSSLINGNNLTAVDGEQIPYRLMIAAELLGVQPVGGVAESEDMVCVGATADIALTGHTGFIQWQESIDGSTWFDVSGGDGWNEDMYTTTPLFASAYYRAEVSQPGFNPEYSNVVFIDVVPPAPHIIAQNDTLVSSSPSGNQWYNQDGLLAGETGQELVVTMPGDYYVIVTEGDCVSEPSNTISVIGTGIDYADHQDIAVYPNPFFDQLSIDIEKSDFQYSFHDAAGRTALSGKASEHIPTRSLIPGYYWLKIYTGESMYIVKVIKGF